jgi:hypothetical protein
MAWRLAGLLLAVLGTTAVVRRPQQHQHAIPEKLGKVSFATSCSPAVQEPFERGVALLHSFTYQAAERQFAEVTKADPTCAMAHWGAAMSYYHQLWEPRIGADDIARGAREIAEAQRLGNGSGREAAFIRALGEFYRDLAATAQAQRGQAYAEAMKRLAEEQKGDAEAQTFYALALLSTASSSDRSRKNQKEAAEILEPLFRKYPEHPGVAHYLIHAYDNPEMARTGLPAARAYRQIAPAAPHALHMPSHIFTLLGLWEDSIQSNQAARRAAHEQQDIGEELHAMDYLEYAYLQAGRYEPARKLLEEVHAMPALQLADFKVGYAATAMPVRYAVERRDWNLAASLPVHHESLPQVSAITHWARAVGLARGGNPGAAEREVGALKQCLGKARAAKEEYWGAQVEIQIAEANAWIAGAQGQGAKAAALLLAAAAQEDGLEKRPITPGAVVPAREQLGELLLQLKQPGAALTEFEAALKNAPGRRGALAGAREAAELAGNQEKARQYKAELF